ncbi:SsgA family sporulation/cell division regulator [Kitasatospora sp. NPDC090091]|uniref:SsgA family sporulation/cell division regulator n=1 Tax=Kitasatospora sp. NPDC090091 TaxID=3364081 RepID=UPI0037FF94C5
MSSRQPGTRDGRTTPHGHPALTLDIERVLGVCTRQAITAEFRYDRALPLVVSVEFVAEGGPRVRWRLGRDLVRQGLHVASGPGDVRIWPSGHRDRATVWLRLASGDTAALFELPLPPLAQWLQHTYELVPAGHELTGVDWDATTTGLLHDPGAPSD